MTQAPSWSSWSPPKVFDEYRLLQPLGRGGMGQVYLAEDTLLERLVAVKFIASVQPDEASRQRFRVEARALARLSHPNVVAVYRVGEVEERPYLVTEFVRGQTLDLIARPLARERLSRISLGMARGLAAAHRQGVLHRDIKPTNAMLTEDEQVKLLDFGLARLLERAGISEEEAQRVSRHGAPAKEYTSEGGLLGTPLYMAPEVLLGGPTTRQSDLYSLGAVLYELCTGIPPRPADGGNLTLEEWARKEPMALLQVAPDLDSRLAALITRCLQNEPEQRFRSAEALCAAIEEWGFDRSAEVPEGNPYRGLRPFEAEHRAFFLGRSTETQILVERLRTESLVVVTGDSGVGKSSLCRAEVLPRVAEGALGDGRRYRTPWMVPGRHPISALATALNLGEDRLGELLRGEARQVGRELLRGSERTEGLLLLVDQCEELFTLCQPEEATRFGEVVARLTTLPGMRVVLAVRGDFFTRLGALPVLGEEVPRALYLLRSLSAEAMRAAIVGPARRKGVEFESEALVETLLGFSIQAPGGLPLLQFTLAALWEARDEARKLLTASALMALGGVSGALARHADEVLAGLLPEQRQAARLLLLQLVTPQGTAARRTREELGLEKPTTRAALDALVQGRLVVVARELGEEETPYFEVAHEALLQGWGTLRRWLEIDGQNRQVRERLEAAATEWVRLDRSRDALWSGRQLVEVESLDLEGLSPRVADFIRASRRKVRQARYLRWGLLVSAPLFVGLGLGGLRIKARWDLEKSVAIHEARAEELLEKGLREKEEAGALRTKAYQLFDEVSGGTADETTVRRRAAEETWSLALTTLKRSEVLLTQAGQSFESALALDPGDTRWRGRVGDVLVERMELAEWFHQRERWEELSQRLDNYDDGTRRRSLSAPPVLSLTTSPTGADVVLERYEEEEGRLRPVAVQVLGKTPLARAEVSSGPGSYRLVLRAPGREVVHYPVLLARGEQVQLRVELPETSRLPRGFIYVPAGRFLYGSADPEGIRRGLLTAPPLHEVHTGAFLISRTEVTFREWMEFLEQQPEAQLARLLPTARLRHWGLDLEKPVNETWRLKLILNGRPQVARMGELLRLPDRNRRQEQEWSQLPVSGISFEEAEEYLAWLDRTGRVPYARLCDEHEWEYAARGADGRPYPHGARLEPDDANFDETYGRKPYAFGPDVVGSHPISESPFGVLDMTGNVYELVRSKWGRDETIIRGGSWYYDSVSMLIANRIIVERKTRDMGTGLRVCADPPR